MRVAIPGQPILAPVAWLLDSGWLAVTSEALTTGTDQEASEAVLGGQADIALVDPVYWARSRTRFRPVSRTAVSVTHEANDLLLLSAVRLDGLEAVSAPPALSGRSEEAVARTLVREYYGVEKPLQLSDTGEVRDEEGRIVAGTEALQPQPHEYVESIPRAWWVLSGTPWVRALPVEDASGTPNPQAEAVIKDVARLLTQEAESVAAAVAKAHGGTEEAWLTLVRALNLSYGAEERKGLSALLAAAARLRLCPKVEDIALPRY